LKESHFSASPLVRDSRLNDITNQLEVAVQQGAAQSTYQQYVATSSSSSNLSFNVQPPSESIVVDRNLLLSARVKFKINIGPNVPVGMNVFQYGQREAFQAFPLSSLFSTVTTTINNTSTSINLQDVLPQMLHMMDEEDLQCYKGMTPTLIDRYYNYSDAINSNNNPLSAFNNAGFNNHLLPRGCHPLVSAVIGRAAGGGSGGSATSPVSLNVLDTWVIEIEADFAEPIFLSPFLVHSRHNDAGLLGVNAMNFVFNVDSQMRRFWSTGLKRNEGAGLIPYTLSLDTDNPFSQARLFFSFLTSQGSNLLNSRNIVPFIDYPRYITSAQNTAPIAAGASGSITINNIQLNQIPDKFIIVCRKRLSDMDSRDSNSFLVINTISVNFNNASGLISSAGVNSNNGAIDLWRMSVANGSKQSWYEFSGKAQIYNAAGGNVQVSTCGSVLIIEPSRDLSLPEFLSSNSLGQFGFQMNINVTNLSNEQLQPEVVVITANSGLFATIAGSSQVQTALLTKKLVVDTATQDGANAISSNEYMQMRGGALSDQIGSALKHVPITPNGE
jgi:hypothetical protein